MTLRHSMPWIHCAERSRHVDDVLLLWWVDQRCHRQRGELRFSLLEALGMIEECVVECSLSIEMDRFGLAEVQAVRSHEADPGAPMLVVVPGEESAAVDPGILMQPHSIIRSK